MAKSRAFNPSAASSNDERIYSNIIGDLAARVPATEDSQPPINVREATIAASSISCLLANTVASSFLRRWRIFEKAARDVAGAITPSARPPPGKTKIQLIKCARYRQYDMPYQSHNQLSDIAE